MSKTWQEYLDALNRHFLDWASAVPCKNKTKELYSPSEKDQKEVIKRYCNRCTAQVDCLVYSLATEESYGVWGGVTEHERRLMIKQIRAAEMRPSHKLHTIRKIALKHLEDKPNEDQAAAQA